MPGLATGMDPNQQMKRKEHDNVSDDDSEDHDELNYKPRPQLPKPFVCMRSLADLIRDLDSGLIDVSPEYQREVVWTADRMTGLIDSLMENFYIPPIILNKKSVTASADNPKGVVHVCVDGKQRLSSVRAFVKGMIPVHDHRGTKWWFSDAITRRKHVLSEDSQRTFLGKEFVSFEFKNLSPIQEEDLFARVQMGVQLSSAEKMRASSGPWQELAKLFVEDFPSIYSLMKDRARAKDFQLTLSCFSQVVEAMHPTAPDGNPILKTSALVIPKLLSNKSALDDGLKSHLASIWNVFKDLITQDEDTFTNANKYLRGVQTFAPMEMVAVAVLISMYSKTRNHTLLLGDIRAMREAIRENFVDIRMNAQVWKFIWNFLEDLEAIRGAVDGSTVQRMMEQAPQTSAETMTSVSVTVPVAGKRKEAPMRAKQPNVLPPLSPPPQPFVVKKEETSPTPLPQPTELRQPKRQRTGTERSAVQQLNDVLVPTRSPEPRPDPPNSKRQYPSMPTHSSSTSMAQKLPHAHFPEAPSPRGAMRPGTTISGESSSNQPFSPWASPSHASASKPSVTTGESTPGYFMSSKAPQPHHRAFIASMSPSIPVTESSIMSPIHSLVATPSAYPSDSGPPVESPPQRILLDLTSNIRTGVGPCSQTHTEQQWSGEIRNATPAIPSNPRRSPVKRKPVQQSRKVSRQNTAAQYNETIDLTSDIEQEHQDLLTSFKAKAVATREQQNVPGRVPLHGTSQSIQRTYVSSPRVPQGFDRIGVRTSAVAPNASTQNYVPQPGSLRVNSPNARVRQGPDSSSFPH